MYETFAGRIRSIVIGRAKSLSDQRLFHKISLIALFAWIGVGSDGLSSSCYGPEEAFKALATHPSLVIVVAAMTMLTIAMLCASYSQIVEIFPGGGGGYLVASKLLGPYAGLVSGSALIVDYVLTIAISIASGSDAVFSLLPAELSIWKLPAILVAVVLLTMINMRGVRESVVGWLPVFLAFVLTHGVVIIAAILAHVTQMPAIFGATLSTISSCRTEMGTFGLLLIIVRSYCVGAGTYTGIEAVSNSLPILREPKVETAKKTMLYMGVSLSFMVGGLLLAYLLCGVMPVDGKTLNAVLIEKVTSGWNPEIGHAFLWMSMISAAGLLFMAAQTGFLDGPRVLSSMAQDRWMPSRFAALSDRFVVQNGVSLMGIAACVVLLATGGSVGVLVILYSINVFITFTISQLAMVKHWLTNRMRSEWKWKLAVNGAGFCTTASLLVSLCVVKFWEGGWATLLATGALIGLAMLVRRHYTNTERSLARLDELVKAFEKDPGSCRIGSSPVRCDPGGKTAVILVNGFNGLGVHTLLAVMRMFPNVFRNYVFLGVGVVDAGNFKGAEEIAHLGRHVAGEASRYAEQMKRMGVYSEAVTAIGTDVIESATALGREIMKRFPSAVFFGGQLVFENESPLTRLLHNFVVFALQRRFFRQGAPFLILPIRV